MSLAQAKPARRRHAPVTKPITFHALSGKGQTITQSVLSSRRREAAARGSPSRSQAVQPPPPATHETALNQKLGDCACIHWASTEDFDIYSPCLSLPPHRQHAAHHPPESKPPCSAWTTTSIPNATTRTTYTAALPLHINVPAAVPHHPPSLRLLPSLSPTLSPPLITSIIPPRKLTSDFMFLTILPKQRGFLCYC
jgi:hypothetical protein